LFSIKVPIMQHWFVLLRDVRQLYPVYVVVQLGLEFWFEWLVISNYEYVLDEHWTLLALTASTMLFAHWLYSIAAGLDILLDILLAVDKEDIDWPGSYEFSHDLTIGSRDFSHDLAIPRKRGSKTDMDSGDLGKRVPAMIREESETMEEQDSFSCLDSV
jgi:hypothetical protein